MGLLKKMPNSDRSVLEYRRFDLSESLIMKTSPFPFFEHTPKQAGYRMPFEGDRHQGTWMAWPYRDEMWPGGPEGGLDTVQRAYAAVATAIAAFEPVTMLMPESQIEAAKTKLPDTLQIQAMATDDSWVRDNGPTLLIDPEGSRAAVCWRFNAWGGKHRPWDQDAVVGQRLATGLGIPIWMAPLGTEGGAIHSDGDGTLLVTETSILNPNRNPGLSKEDATRILEDATGAEKVIWLPGDETEVETDGHVDLLANFVAPGVIIHGDAADQSDPRYPILQKNKMVLENATDAKGRRFDLIPMPEARSSNMPGDMPCRSYINFYLVNGGVVMPTYGTGEDARAHHILREAFPDRKVVGVDCTAIAPGGGAVHCITQQIVAQGKT